MTSYVYTLQPDEALSSRVRALKVKAFSIVGEQKYISDDPHLTLYLCESKAFKSFGKDLAELFTRLRPILSGMRFSIGRWEVFEDDMVTKGHTLTCPIEGDSLTDLRDVQRKLVKFLSSFRSKGIPARYEDIRESLTQDYEENLLEYGFPFVGDIWKPHFTVASFEPTAFEKAWRALEPELPVGSYGFDSLSVWELKEDETMSKVVSHRIRDDDGDADG